MTGAAGVEPPELSASLPQIIDRAMVSITCSSADREGSARPMINPATATPANRPIRMKNPCVAARLSGRLDESNCASGIYLWWRKSKILLKMHFGLTKLRRGSSYARR